ncbi:MAG: 1-acyl-sn-glycerol-3-phosphate acyltransferase [Leptospira sp.]|nr:1-acyl-sn-glycerol-3-phosphate acyltransferase [Leptospira sp.]
MGSGPMGLIISSLLSRKLEEVYLWIPDTILAQEMKKTREGNLLQSPYRIADNIHIISDYMEFERNSWCFHIAVPSRTLEENINHLLDTIDNRQEFVFNLFTKGLLPHKTRRRLGLVTFSSLIEHLSKEKSLSDFGIAAINGPSLLQELVDEQHSFFNIGSHSKEAADYLADLFQFPFIHTSTTKELHSMEMAGVLKNPIAIAMGIASVLPGSGSNIQGELLRLGFMEMLAFAKEYNLSQEIFMGRSGLSDLITTSTSKRSRNRNYGKKMVGELMVGPEKLSIKDRLEIWVTPKSFIEREVSKWHDTVEGAYALGIILELAAEKNLELPLYKTLFEVLSRKIPPISIANLLTGKKSSFPLQKLVGVKKQGMDLAAGEHFQYILEERIIKSIVSTSGFLARIKKQSASTIDNLEKRKTRATRKKDTKESDKLRNEIILWNTFANSGREEELSKARQIIRFYVKEIADSYKPAIRDSLMKFVTPFRFFSGGMKWGSVTAHLGGEVEKVKQLSEKYNLLYTPRHQSHLDSVEMAYALNKLNLPTPRYAAGVNLMSSPFWEWMLKSLGAYAVDRERTRNSLYLECLSVYSSLLLESGIPSLVYPEGTRSRTGEIVPIKTGILKTAIDAFRNTGSEIVIIPISISYETVPEDTEFVGIPEKLSLNDFLNKRSNVYMDFCEPIPISEHIGNDDPSLSIGSGIVHGWAKYHRILPNQIIAKILTDNEMSLDVDCLPELIHEFILSNPGNYLTTNVNDIQKSGINRLKKCKIIEIEDNKIMATESNLVTYYGNMVPINKSREY